MRPMSLAEMMVSHRSNLCIIAKLLLPPLDVIIFLTVLFFGVTVVSYYKMVSDH